MTGAQIFYHSGPRPLELTRCARYWALWRRGEHERLAAHLESCGTCRAWLDQFDETGAAGWRAVLERDHREGDYLNAFGLRPGGE